MPKFFKHDVKSVKTYPGADVGSDHNPVVMEFRVRLKKQARAKYLKTLDINKLKDVGIRQDIANSLHQGFLRLKDETSKSEINNSWIKIKQVKVGDCKENLKPDERSKKQK